MGTHQVKLWTTCLGMLDTLLIPENSDEGPEWAAPISALLDGLKGLEACPKATWKKLVIEMHV